MPRYAYALVLVGGAPAPPGRRARASFKLFNFYCNLLSYTEAPPETRSADSALHVHPNFFGHILPPRARAPQRQRGKRARGVSTNRSPCPVCVLTYACPLPSRFAEPAGFLSPSFSPAFVQVERGLLLPGCLGGRESGRVQRAPVVPPSIYLLGKDRRDATLSAASPSN